MSFLSDIPWQAFADIILITISRPVAVTLILMQKIAILHASHNDDRLA